MKYIEVKDINGINNIINPNNIAYITFSKPMQCVCIIMTDLTDDIIRTHETFDELKKKLSEV